jgi:serine/threonine protein phosphatase PrpC
VTAASTTTLEIESLDEGPGIADVSRVVDDGFSTAGGLGLGLGTVNRLVDHVEITSPVGSCSGTRILCRRALRTASPATAQAGLDIGTATRPRPPLHDNGDALVVKRTGDGALVGVIDGLGHGLAAQQAAETAREYVERHVNLPLGELFAGVERACHATRGVVMALGQVDPSSARLQFASVGNIESRLVDGPERAFLGARRGVLGMRAPNPVVTQHVWGPGSVLVMHSDGLSARWHWQTFEHFKGRPATLLADELFQALARTEDDATVLVAKHVRHHD